MLTTLLIIAIAVSSTSIVLQVRAHRRWSLWAESTERLWLAHNRVVNHVYPPVIIKPKLPPPPTMAFPLVRPANWEDDRLKTRNMRHGETFMPVDFRHDMW